MTSLSLSIGLAATAIITVEMRDWSSSKTHSKGLKRLSPVIFFLMLSLTTALTFHALAATEPNPNDIGDRDLPDWCPPSNDPGLAVICGTVVSAGVQEAVPGIQQANVPKDKIMVAVYEENIISPTGKLSGALTNIFASTTTNKLGRYRITVRRVKPPRLKVHLVFFCGATRVQELVVDSWHNTWDLFTQIDCTKKIKTSTVSPQDDSTPPQPPFPLRANASASNFLGCTNERFTDTAIGLEKHEEPTINTIINEKNYDHRFNMNPISVTSNISFFNKNPLVAGPVPPTFTFTSPGGLWEPDCLLRNEEGTYQCNALACGDWEKNAPTQPCTDEGKKANCGPNGDQVCPNANISCGITPGYTGAKVYAAGSCTPDPTGINADGTLTSSAQEFVDACKAKNAEDLAKYIAANNKLPSDPIDGVLCDAVFKSVTHPTGAGVPMTTEDYITRPFFKYIPKGIPEYSAPFRRFEYRNNLQNYAVDSLSPMQWINTYVGSAANGNGLPIGTVRAFMGAVSLKPGVPNCASLYQRNMPFQDKGVTVTQNRMINSGYITALSEPYSTFDETYYSGQKDLSAYVCQQDSGELVRICEIQVPWGEGALCDVNKPGCNDGDLKSNLRKSLNRLTSATSLVDPNTATQVANNINNMLNFCGKDFKLGKLYFPQDLIFKAGNTQMGLQSDTPNDSIPAYAERRDSFTPASNEQEAEAQTGSRIVFQGGGNFMANSFNTILCALDPKVCNNNKGAASLTNVLTLPYTESIEDVKKRYLDDTTWTVDSLGPKQTSMCSISNIYAVDIRGPYEETEGVATLASGTKDLHKAPLQGGMFDQLFTKNSQHKEEFTPGTATWYMSGGSILRDKVTMTQQGLMAFFFPQFWGDNGSRSVGTSSEFINHWAFASLIGRDVWDSMLTLAGGDAALHDMTFPLDDIDDAILASLAGGTPWKSYGNRGPGGAITPADKPYYSVTFEYPLTEATFKEKFKLPGLTESADGTSSYEETELLPEEWGPGHVCYGFDTAVAPGQICGTYREAPEGVSRTCRLDKCVAFNRVETATCTCSRKVIEIGPGGVVTLGDPGDADCEIHSREDRNLIISDCTRDDRLRCANLQETSRAWQECQDGYDRVRKPVPGETTKCTQDADGNCVIHTCYFRDTRSGKDTTGPILPPDDIDVNLEANDQEDKYGGYQDPPEIPDSPELCNPEMFEWGPNTQSRSRGLVWKPNNVRPRCWVSTAGPFRKFPNFGAVGQSTPQPVRKSTGQTVENCNGYIKIEDSALRAKQVAPYANDPEINQKQQNLDESTIIGIKVLKTFAPPYAPTWGGNKLALIDSKETNNGLVSAEGLPTDTYTRGQTMNMGGVGDVSTIRNFFTTPVMIPIQGKEGELRPMFYHCDYESSHTLDTRNKKQKEYFSMMSQYDPDLDGIGGWKCPIVPAPDPQLPNIENKTNGNCAVKGFEKCELLLKKVWTNGVTASVKMTELEKAEKMAEIARWHFSPRFVNAINWTAYQSNTPGAALMTVMFLEGGLDIQYMKNWSDDAWVYKSSVPWYGQMDLGGPATCNDLVWSAQGPYQLIKHWVQCLVDPESKACVGDNVASESSKEISKRFCNSLNKAGKGRCESVLNAGRCNLIDASMITAFFMNPQAGLSPGSCGGFDLSTALQLFSGGSYTLEGGQSLNDVAAEVYANCQ